MNVTGVTGFPPGESFFDALAAHLVETHPAEATGNDFSRLRVLVPALPMAAELRAALSKRLPGAALLPVFCTLRQWAQTVDPPVTPLPSSRRRVLLYEALRARGWFDESALWGIATAMAALFDELTEASVRLPEDATALAAQLEKAYALRASLPLAFEARVVHELWRVLAASGESDAAALYRLQLADLARHAAQPLFVLLDAGLDEALSTGERDFIRCYAERQRVGIVYPLPRESAATPLLDALAAAWPASMDAPPMIDRARALARRCEQSPLAGRLSLMSATGCEQEAQAAVAQLGLWLHEGVRRIALIAQDRLTARRVRALLDREGVLVSDETGWLLSTSRAAAAVDALLETVAGHAYHRDLLDLCKTPFVFADMPEVERQAGVFALETAIRGASASFGLPNFRRILQDSDIVGKDSALALLDRLDAADTLLGARPASLARWLSRLYKAMEVLGMLSALTEDIAGKVLLDTLETRQAELIDDASQFTLSAWRDWLGHEFESASFRDDRVASPIVVTPLNAVCLRRFEAALLIGGDARQLSPSDDHAFFNQTVRRELGLRTRADSERELRRDLELLLATVPRVVVTWQSVQDGEANLPAPEFLLLSTLHALAWGDDLQRPIPPLRPVAAVEGDTAPALPQASASAVTVPAALLPTRISVSGYNSLVDCPYRFFARHVLRLGELGEVREEMEKSDYGTLVHRTLQEFHARCPQVSALSEDEALSILRACTEAAFAPAVDKNFLDVGWRQRWENRLPDYLAWQLKREAVGWRWADAEIMVSRALPLAGGGRVELYGRIDRIDRNANGEAALLDYKTQSAQTIRKQLDNVQLASYALMHAATEAAYVMLDDVAVDAKSPVEGEELAVQATAQGERLATVFDAMRAGAPLTAHGIDRVCNNCEMLGLCRKTLLE